MQVASIHIYPVKSLRGFSVQQAEVDDLGFVGDRRFLVVDGTGRLLTQRVLPKMAQIDATLSDASLTLSIEGGGSVVVPRDPQPGAELTPVSVWSSEGLMAEYCGPESARWLTGILGVDCRLVRIGPAFRRDLKPSKAKPGDRVAFSDAYPFMVVSEASLSDLNDRLLAQGEEAIPMDRFRPSLVIRGAQPFEEETWTTVSIGSVAMRGGEPCSRCPVTTTDQKTGMRGHEPLRTLAKYRRDATESTKVNFGQNLIHETKTGVIRVGDVVRGH